MAFKPNDTNRQNGRLKGSRNKATIRRELLAAIILDPEMPAAVRAKAASELMDMAR